MTVCKKCGIEKPESSFSKFTNRLATGRITSGHRKECKDCENSQRKRVTIDAACPQCGAVRQVRHDTFKKTGGFCRSCALENRIIEKGPPRATRRGDKLANHQEYARWKSMRARCDPNTKNPTWKRRYSDRGITICEEWQDPWLFIEWARKSGFSSELTLDRINNNKSYSPENCRWVDMKAQSRNKESNARITVLNDGRVFNSIAEAAEALNTSQDRIYKSISRGWKCFGLSLVRG